VPAFLKGLVAQNPISEQSEIRNASSAVEVSKPSIQQADLQQHKTAQPR